MARLSSRTSGILTFSRKFNKPIRVAPIGIAFGVNAVCPLKPLKLLLYQKVQTLLHQTHKSVKDSPSFCAAVSISARNKIQWKPFIIVRLYFNLEKDANSISR